jgi:hypothetical protein
MCTRTGTYVHAFGSQASAPSPAHVLVPCPLETWYPAEPASGPDSPPHTEAKPGSLGPIIALNQQSSHSWGSPNPARRCVTYQASDPGSAHPPSGTTAGELVPKARARASTEDGPPFPPVQGAGSYPACRAPQKHPSTRAEERQCCPPYSSKAILLTPMAPNSALVGGKPRPAAPQSSRPKPTLQQGQVIRGWRQTLATPMVPNTAAVGPMPQPATPQSKRPNPAPQEGQVVLTANAFETSTTAVCAFLASSLISLLCILLFDYAFTDACCNSLVH